MNLKKKGISKFFFIFGKKQRKYYGMHSNIGPAVKLEKTFFECRGIKQKKSIKLHH